MGKAFAITFSILLFFAGFVFYRTGYYKEVLISSGEQGPFILVYKIHKGPYHKIAPVIDGVEKFFKDNQLPCPLAFGRYLHDPNQVEHDRLESHGGCLFSMIDDRLDQVLKKSDYTVESIPKKEYLVATFSGSPSIGPFKVYPKVKKWMAKYGYIQKDSVIEIYQTTGEDEVVSRYLFEYK